MMPKHYLQLSGLLSQTPTAIWSYRANEAVCVDTMGRAWLNPFAEPYREHALGQTQDPVPFVHVKLTEDGRRILLLQRADLRLSAGEETFYRWTPQAVVPPGWIPVDEIEDHG